MESTSIRISLKMKKIYFYYFLFSFAFISCKDAERTCTATPEEVVNQPSQREINTGDIVVPEGDSIEAVNTGLSYPVDVTFDEEENYYIAEAGRHTYGPKPPRAPKTRILKVFPNRQVEVICDKVVPMTEIKESASNIIGIGHFSHVIAGSVETFTLVFMSEVSWMSVI